MGATRAVEHNEPAKSAEPTQMPLSLGAAATEFEVIAKQPAREVLSASAVR
jgi:hypothetical protein